MLKQHRELSMSVRRTIENNEEASIRPSKTYQSFVAAAGIHHELNFIEKELRNYITREHNSLLVYLAHHEEDSKQIKWLQQTPRNRTRNEPLWSCGQQVAFGYFFAKLYEDRHIWIPIYLNHHFWVGMRSTQRSEIMHTFFNKFIIRNSSLIQFVKQYDNCLGSRE
ncbi:hypothetical protein Ahy_A01g003367 [Arachis hypogaea]|uniref:Uncharacterized protein n=1 Tax=Arachis hypogaea TaxID=3818 RepID=A0A445ET66_ARAHY|nr:hypothetical protein Ahy_A01g003367 [Arachis hypogaea]